MLYGNRLLHLFRLQARIGFAHKKAGAAMSARRVFHSGIYTSFIVRNYPDISYFLPS
jgi:hypothetical protein